jgi:hypothetical protein
VDEVAVPGREAVVARSVEEHEGSARGGDPGVHPAERSEQVPGEGPTAPTSTTTTSEALLRNASHHSPTAA